MDLKSTLQHERPETEIAVAEVSLSVWEHHNLRHFEKRWINSLNTLLIRSPPLKMWMPSGYGTTHCGHFELDIHHGAKTETNESNTYLYAHLYSYMNATFYSPHIGAEIGMQP